MEFSVHLRELTAATMAHVAAHRVEEAGVPLSETGNFKIPCYWKNNGGRNCENYLSGAMQNPATGNERRPERVPSHFRPRLRCSGRRGMAWDTQEFRRRRKFN